MNYYDIIHSPVVSEKTIKMADLGMYAFWVSPKANKLQIKNAIQKAFDVKVIGISTMNIPGKTKRVGRFIGKRNNRKKAVVRLASGQKIDVFQGLLTGE